MTPGDSAGNRLACGAPEISYKQPLKHGMPAERLLWPNGPTETLPSRGPVCPTSFPQERSP